MKGVPNYAIVRRRICQERAAIRTLRIPGGAFLSVSFWGPFSPSLQRANGRVSHFWAQKSGCSFPLAVILTNALGTGLLTTSDFAAAVAFYYKHRKGKTDDLFTEWRLKAFAPLIRIVVLHSLLWLLQALVL